MRGNWTSPHFRKFLLSKSDALCRLYNPNLIFPAFRLSVNHITAVALVETDVEFIDLNLPDPFHAKAMAAELVKVDRQVSRFLERIVETNVPSIIST